MSPRAPHRFFYSGQLSGIDPKSPEANIALSTEESHHLIHVLRIRRGASVDVFDKLGQSRSAEVTGTDDGIAHLRVVAQLEVASSGAPLVNLAVSVLKRRPMDMMIEKLSELGVGTLQPLLTARSIGHSDIPKYDSVPERWQRLTLAAAKQCGRNRPMDIEPPMPVLEWLEKAHSPALCACAHGGSGVESIGHWLSKCQGSPQTRQLAIGPEGGWMDEELEAFKAAGYTLVHMGDLTLRAETAAIAAAAACRLF